jgi:GTP-binding protein EngB required for normal cell division
LKNSNFIEEQPVNLDSVLTKLDKIKDDNMRLQNQMNHCAVSFLVERLDGSLKDIRSIFADKKREF